MTDFDDEGRKELGWLVMRMRLMRTVTMVVDVVLGQILAAKKERLTMKMAEIKDLITMMTVTFIIHDMS